MFDLFEISKSGLLAHSKNIEIAGQNITNASTPGYTRQDAILSPQAFYGRNGEMTGLGVRVTDVRRIRSELIDIQIRERSNIETALKGELNVFERLQNVFTTNTPNDIDVAINNMFDSYSILTANPESFSLRQEAIRSTQNTVDQFKRIAGEFQNLETLIQQETASNVSEINRIIKDISRLDNAITLSSADGRQQDNRALDVRNQKLRELGDIVALDYNTDVNNSLTLRIGSIVVLQNGRQTNIRHVFDPINNTNQIKLESGKVLFNPGGRIGANIKAYEETIPFYEDQVNQLAVNLKDAMNKLHLEGKGIDDNGSRALFNSTSRSAFTLSLNQDIVDNVNHLALSLTNDAPGNSDNAARIANLRNDQATMGSSGFTEFALNLQQSAGGRVNSLRSELETAAATRELFENQQEDLAGVSIDEELANILKFQNAYQASARVMNTAQTVFDSLLSVVR